jgi:hypothetical protein
MTATNKIDAPCISADQRKLTFNIRNKYVPLQICVETLHKHHRHSEEPSKRTLIYNIYPITISFDLLKLTHKSCFAKQVTNSSRKLQESSVNEAAVFSIPFPFQLPTW